MTFKPKLTDDTSDIVAHARATHALTKGRVLSPAEVARIRTQIARNVESYLPLIDEVVRGTREFTPTQARVFTALLNKVVPDLSATFHKHEHETRDLSNLSMAELEAIASGVASTKSEMLDADDILQGEVLSSRTADPE